MNRLGWHWWPSDTTVATDGLRGTCALHQSRPLHTRLARRGRRRARTSPTGPRRCAPASNCARIAGCARSRRTSRAWPPASCITTRTASEQFQAGRSRRARLQRRRHAAAAAEFGLRAVPERARQFQRAGRQEPDVPSLCPGLRVCRRGDGQQPRAADLPVEQGVLRNRPVTRLRARLHVSIRPRRRAGRPRPSPAKRRACCPGARAITPLSAASMVIAWACRRSARICRRSITASHSTRC